MWYSVPQKGMEPLAAHVPVGLYPNLIAQLAEQEAFILWVVGSSPTKVSDLTEKTERRGQRRVSKWPNAPVLRDNGARPNLPRVKAVWRKPHGGVSAPFGARKVHGRLKSDGHDVMGEQPLPYQRRSRCLTVLRSH